MTSQAGSRRTAPSTRQTPSSPLAKRIVRAHQRLLGSPLYLAHPDFRDHVKWVRCGIADILVERTSKQPVSESAPADDDQGDLTPEPAVLSFVFHITSDDFFMTADGGYRGPTKYAQSLAEVKPTCTGTIPSLEPFRSDFFRAVDNIQWLEEEIATPTFDLKRGFLVERPDQPPKIRVRHVLFEPRPREDEDRGERSEGGPSGGASGDSATAAAGSHTSSLPREFTLEKWPVESDAAKRDLQEIKASKSFDIVPLPAYDENGKLIRPQDYRALLAGAVVEVHCTLSHWSIGGRRGEPPADSYAADVQYMRVLVPAPRIPTVSRKRLISLTDPLSSPSKKQRTT